MRSSTVRVATLTALGALLLGRSSAYAQHQAPHVKHWGYENSAETVGPAQWGELPGDNACSVGKQQSPIGLALTGARAATPAPGPALAFDYHASKLAMINNGHTVQMNVDSGSTVSEAAATYRLVQFHFHAPSEHTLNGKHFPLEIHLVHVNAAGAPALVVGVFVEEGSINAALATAFDSLPKQQGDARAPAGALVDANGLLPAAAAHFAYDGSLTTPPCSEGIRWRVMGTPITMSKAQIDAFRSLPHLGHTARPVQPAGGRVDLLIGAP